MKSTVPFLTVRFFLSAILTFPLLSIHAQEAKASAQDPEKLLAASDISRGGVEEGLTWMAEVTTKEDGDTSVRKFTIKAKDTDSIAESLFPPRNKGEIYVFNDRNMWFLKPGLKKPVSISPRAKLTGLASNGDIATTRYARDYSATLEKEETIDNAKHYVLLLKAKSESTTYDKIRYWIHAETNLATKAQFLTLGGDILKTARFEYKNKLNVKGKTYPFVSEMIIVDAKKDDYTSTISYQKIKKEKFATGAFNINNIRP